MVFDAAVYGVVLDALNHPGPADKTRVDKALCQQGTMPGVSPGDLTAGEVDFWSHAPPQLGEHQVKSEPSLAGYAS
jgi:hypothetical protein